MMREVKGYVFRNWAKTFSCTPEIYFEPRTIEDLRKILSRAQNEKKVVRVAGKGHSPGDIACTTDFLVSLKNFNEIEIDRAGKCAKVGGGVVISDLNEELDKAQLALPVLGSISDLTLAGAISTGTHGNGHNHGILSAYVTELELLTSNGELLVVSRTHQQDLFLAACCSLGALGIITSLTIQCVEAFNLEKHSYGTKVEHILEYFEEHSKCSSHFKILWYPPDMCVVEHGNPTQKCSDRQSSSWFWDIFVGVYILELLLYISSFIPSITMPINKLFFKYVASPSAHSIGKSYRQFNMNCRFSQYVMEWSIPREKSALVLLELKAWVENTQFPAHFPVEIRPAKADDIYLSPAHGHDVTFINIIMYRPFSKTIPFESYWKEFQKIMMENGGRPHWAKDFIACSEDLKKMYPKWDDFCQIRKKLDPNGIFLNKRLRTFFC